MRTLGRVHTLVVGAGSAGCVVASRLSEDPRRSVMLVEAGPDYAAALLPRDLANGGRNSLRAHDWGQRHRPTATQVLFPFPRGRVVGGSSAVNTCIGLRGMPEDYDEWASLGLDGWGWQECLPFFKRLETDLDFGDGPLHGGSGPLRLRRHRPDELSPWQAAFVAAARALGYPDAPDSNDPSTTGVGMHAMNKVDGRRISAAEAWLNPAVRQRANLAIRPSTHVRRLRVQGRRVTGVYAVDADGEALIEAEHVLVALGATQTPHLLMRSGVGPRALLEAWGVEVVADHARVGARLLDHPGFAMFFWPRGRHTRPEHPLIQAVLRFRSDDNAQRNDMTMQAGSRVPLPRFELPACSLMAMLGKPLGSGSITWKSARDDERPRIEQRFLEHPTDMRRAVDAMRRAGELAATEPLRSLGRHLVPWAPAVRDGDAIRRWIGRFTDSGYHPCGTVPMGPGSSDPVDAGGRVRGVDGLYVVDASVMPTIPSSNIHLPVLMVAEKLAAGLAATLGS